MISMRKAMRRLLVAAAATVAAAGFAQAQEPLKLDLGVLATGTVKWEIAAMQALGADKAHNLALEVRDVADTKAGQIALQAGEVDVILSDFVWVSLQRHEGNMVTMVPHSLTVGGLMVDPAADIETVADLKGKTIAVSGSPVDKSYVVLAAYYNLLTGGTLTEESDGKFGAPPLVNELLLGGQAQAALNLWNWNARAKIAGKVELISVPDMLAGLGVRETPPLLGWAFFDETAARKAEAMTAFLDASFDTKRALLTDDALWDQIRGALNVGENDALFRQYREDYRAGIVAGYDPRDMTAAVQSFEVMAKFGGRDVVGDATELAEGTFWAGYSNPAP